MKAAKIEISLGLLESILPHGSRILCVREDEYRNLVILGVEHPTFDEVPEGQFPPTRTLVAHKDDTIPGVRLTYAA
jgi:hypothetical protein